MGVRENIVSIINTIDIKLKEMSIGKSIVKTSTVESQFLSEYESFKVNLYSFLENYILIKGGKSVIVRPKNRDVSRYLKYTMTDPEMSGSFKISQKAGGEFEFRQGDTLNDLYESRDDKGNDDDNNDNIIYV